MKLDRSLEHLVKEHPILDLLMNYDEVFWINDKMNSSSSEALEQLPYKYEDIKDAELRLKRFAPYLLSAFPEISALKERKGIIESPLRKIETFKEQGNVLLKMDSHLPISGSIKARGGIYEVLTHAERLAVEKNKLSLDFDYERLNNLDMKEFFGQYEIVVGSTGNLGMSIGIMGAKLGFKVSVHMSNDAKEWKKTLLRSKGVNVVEHASDYSKAVEMGRAESDAKENSYFVDDENSLTLFLGYAVAALRLKEQIKELGIVVDAEHPLFVYIPCGVGGGPGGIAFGLKHVFGDHVHCFFAEPTHSPCMLIGMETGLHDKVSVQDFGINNMTEADGLAVGRPSGLVGKIMDSLLSGISTVDDQKLYKYMTQLYDQDGIFLEPSALAGFKCLMDIVETEKGTKYLKDNNLYNVKENINHIVWATGGSMVPEDIKAQYLEKARQTK